MAKDAGTLFAELVASGEDIPYDVNESGACSPLPQYVPLTERFIREHAARLRELDSFGAAGAALESAELAGPYLDQLEIAVPPEPRRRAELACVVLLCRLWFDRTDFDLPPDRLADAIDELEAGADTAEDEIEVIVPLRGLQMPAPRLELATAMIVLADTVEVPVEARTAEGTAAAGWEPTFLGAVRVSGIDRATGEEQRPDAGARAVEAFRHLITALRLFKPGGVGLGPHAWARSANDRWRRIATGAGRPRPGGYRLTEEELGELVAFSGALANRSNPFGRPARHREGLSGALARSISRFEAGLERHAVMEALNDYLLALRFLLEGGGPADLGLAMRVAALCAEPERRDETKAVVDRALALERSLWTGEPPPVGDGLPTPAGTAAAVEELTRAILKDAACGHLGSDLRATADEILLADGLAVGEGAREQRGATEEWEPPAPEEPLEEAGEVTELLELEPETDEPGTGMDGEREEAEPEAVEWGELEDLEWSKADADPEWGELDAGMIEHGEADGRDRLQVPEPAGRITVERGDQLEEEEEDVSAYSYAQDHRPESDRDPRAAIARPVGEPSRARQLLAERQAERERIANRVAHLFPRPETTEWNVREIAYDRRRRASVRELRAS